MKRFFLLALLHLCAVSCVQNELKSKIAELDKELEIKEVYVHRFEERVDSLRNTLNNKSICDSLRWEAAYSTYSAFSYVNADSTMKYLDVLDGLSSTLELKNRTEACRIRCYGLEPNQERLIQALKKIDPESVSVDFRQRYFDEIQRASVLVPKRTSLKKKILHSALEFHGLDNDLRKRYEGLMLMYDKNYSDALACFAESYEAAATDHMKALSSYNQAVCYKHLKDTVSYCKWLAQSAIFDIKVPVSEYSSLLELSNILFELGEYTQASQYIQVVMGDAIQGNWNSRIQLSARSQKAIFDSLDKSHRQLIRLMMTFIVFLVLSVLIVSILTFYSFRQNKRLRYLNEKISEINRKLKDEGRIKENYLFKYMEMSVEGMGKLDEYRHKVRQVLKEEGPDALKAMLRAPRSSSDYKTFYENFDKTFLSLYPDFISQVNKLMSSDEQFKQNDLLNTDLRILATIRLGFTDSGQIAKFLNIPSTSVYTRRSALRRKSTCEKLEFDQKIRQIT